MSANDGTRDRGGGNAFGRVYECVLSQCGHPPYFGPPWQHIPLPVEARGAIAIADVDATLARLPAQFPMALVRDTGILKRHPDGSERLEPALTDPTGGHPPLRPLTDSPPVARPAARPLRLSQRPMPFLLSNR